MRRREFIAGLGSAVAWPMMARAQQSPRTPHIGFLGAASATGYASQLREFRSGLSDLGYEEGRNITIELRWADGKYDRLDQLAAELVLQRVDVLVTHGTPGTRAAKKATPTIPIVMAGSGDAVGYGLVESLNRPGGNVTGSSFFNPELSTRRLELIKEAVPRITKIGYLFNSDNYMVRLLEMMEPAAAILKMQLRRFPVRAPNEIDGAFVEMVRSGINCISRNSI
jgi:putative ABC transport system substrate-binding protein